MLQPSFTPKINKNTDKLLNESKINPRGLSPIHSYIGRESSFKKSFDKVVRKSVSPNH